MSYTLKEGEKRTIRGKVRRRTGTGAIALTSPQYRILDSARAVITGFDWATAQWNPTVNEVTALFDSTQAALLSPATYYVQLRGVIGAELYALEVEVILEEWGP